jgi:hypothetical protein
MIALLLAVSAASAHHSFTMFDRSIEKVATGTVVRWTFNPPHSWLYMNVKDKDGKETLWSFEGSAPTALLQRGINGKTFEPGNTVTILYCPLRDGRPGRRAWLGETRRRQVRQSRRRRLQRERRNDRALEGLAREGLYLEYGSTSGD